jgi:hypothetical protein
MHLPGFLLIFNYKPLFWAPGLGGLLGRKLSRAIWALPPANGAPTPVPLNQLGCTPAVSCKEIAVSSSLSKSSFACNLPPPRSIDSHLC